MVHDDRITYIDGDSVATNVVCGYDTVWAYFYEHERGNISAKSLDYNVGKENESAKNIGLGGI